MVLCHAGVRERGGNHPVLLVQRVRKCGHGAQDFHGRHGQPDAGIHPELLRHKILYVHAGYVADGEEQSGTDFVQRVAGAVSGRGAGGDAPGAQQAAAVHARQDAHPPQVPGHGVLAAPGDGDHPADVGVLLCVYDGGHPLREQHAGVCHRRGNVDAAAPVVRPRDCAAEEKGVITVSRSPRGFLPWHSPGGRCGA